MKRIAALLFACSLLAQPAAAQIAKDASVDFGYSGTSPHGGSFTVGAGANRILTCFSEQNSSTLTGITYGGTALTLLTSQAEDGSAGSTYLYYLLAPTSGTATVAASWSGSGNTNVGCISYSGVNQSAPTLFGSVNAGGTTGCKTVSLTTTAGNSWLVVGGSSRGDSDPTACSGTANSYDGSATYFFIGDSGDSGTAGSKTVGVQFIIAGDVVIAVALAPAGGGPPASPAPCALRLLGVGCDEAQQ